jgi:hypothetical protein
MKKQIFKINGVRVLAGFSWLRIRSGVAGSYEHSKKYSGLKKVWDSFICCG